MYCWCDCLGNAREEREQVVVERRGFGRLKPSRLPRYQVCTFRAKSSAAPLDLVNQQGLCETLFLI